MDDNDARTLRRGLGGAQILAVPTLDWPGVALEHFRSNRWRALENGIPVVRGAFGGWREHPRLAVRRNLRDAV